MSTMIERVAMAILAKDGEQLGYMVDLDEARGIAKAAIAAMREPTNLMTWAGMDEGSHMKPVLGRGMRATVDTEEAGDIWKAMIDAALNEEG